jgi:hypothetical protein
MILEKKLWHGAEEKTVGVLLAPSPVSIFTPGRDQ